MTMPQAPGFYLEAVQPNRIGGALLRSDIAAFAGYTRRGPLFQPLRIESWQQFLNLFGRPLETGYLAPAVKAFFENGGATCYVLRVAAEVAQPAFGLIPDQNGNALWQVRTGFRLRSVTLTETAERERSDDPALLDVDLDQLDQTLANPGSWGNTLEVFLTRSDLLHTAVGAVVDDGRALRLGSLAGLAPYAVLELLQEHNSTAGEALQLRQAVLVAEVDHGRAQVVLAQPLDLALFDLNRAIEARSVDFDVRIDLEKRTVESFRALGPHPDHPRSLHRLVSRESNFLALEYLGDPAQSWLQSGLWPQPTQLGLSGGRDGLATVRGAHFSRAINAFARVDEISVLALPDLVLEPAAAAALTGRPPVPAIDCAALKAPDPGIIEGRVTDGINFLAGVLVVDAQSGQQAKTDMRGHFRLADLAISLRELRLSKAGFGSAEALVPASLPANASQVQLALAPLEDAPRLSDQEILQVQRELAEPGRLGAYRVALLDPPSARMKIDEIRAWRSRLGDSALTPLFYPWLQVAPAADSAALLEIPPCGHVAGLLAAQDRRDGPHRSPANLRLRFAKGVTQNVNEREHGLLNPEGINVLRVFPGRGIRIFGARTLSSAAEWRYLNVRRLIFAIERTLEASLQWSVFESNTPILRQALVMAIYTLLHQLWRRGALAGTTVEGAFQIKSDRDNNPGAQVDNGQLVVHIALAPSVPFEFIHLRLDRTLDAVEVTE